MPPPLQVSPDRNIVPHIQVSYDAQQASDAPITNHCILPIPPKGICQVVKVVKAKPKVLSGKEMIEYMRRKQVTSKPNPTDQSFAKQLSTTSPCTPGVACSEVPSITSNGVIGQTPLRANPLEATADSSVDEQKGSGKFLKLAVDSNLRKLQFRREVKH